MKEIIPGCWIETEYYGEAVCIGIQNIKEGKLYSFRYKAIQCIDQKTIWVKNGLLEQYVKYLKEPDVISQYVLTLTGLYGEGL